MKLNASVLRIMRWKTDTTVELSTYESVTASFDRQNAAYSSDFTTALFHKRCCFGFYLLPGVWFSAASSKKYTSSFRGKSEARAFPDFVFRYNCGSKMGELNCGTILL